MEFSIQILPAHLHPPSMEKKHLSFTIFFYVSIIFIIPKFGENFEDKIDLCFLKNV